METQIPTPTTELVSSETIAKVDAEFKAVGFDNFRKEEMGLIEQQNHSLHQAIEYMYRSGIQQVGLDSADKMMAGVVYTHRLLRYSFSDHPGMYLPAVIYQQRLDMVVAKQEEAEREMLEVWRNNKNLENSFEALTNLDSKVGMTLVLFLHKNLLLPPIEEGHAAQKVSDEVKSLGFGEFRKEEMQVIAKQNQILHQIIENSHEASIKDEGPDKANKKLAGMLYAHRVLRYGLAESSLYPLNGDSYKRQLYIINTGQIPEVMRMRDEIFKGHPELGECYLSLTNSDSKAGMLTMLVLHKDLLLPPVDDSFIKQADAEFEALGPEGFREEETRLIKDKNPHLSQVVENIYEKAKEKGGLDGTDRLLLGMLFTHRLLRYKFTDSKALRLAPEVYEEKLKFIYTGTDKQVHEAIEEVFANNPAIADCCSSLTHKSSKFGMTMMLLLYKELLV